MEYPATPMLDKMSKVHEESQPIGEFVEWLKEQGYVLAKWSDEADVLYPALIGTESLLAEYFDIDLTAANRERDAVLEYIRTMNK